MSEECDQRVRLAASSGCGRTLARNAGPMRPASTVFRSLPDDLAFGKVRYSADGIVPALRSKFWRCGGVPFRF